MFVAEPAVAWNDVGAAFLLMFGDGNMDDPVQGINDSIDGATRLYIKIRISRGNEDIARADDIGFPEKDDAVAIRVRRRYMDDLDRLVVEVKLFLRREIRVRRPCPAGRGRLLAGRRAHSVEDIDMGDDRCRRRFRFSPGPPVSGFPASAIFLVPTRWSALVGGFIVDPI